MRPLIACGGVVTLVVALTLFQAIVVSSDNASVSRDRPGRELLQNSRVGSGANSGVRWRPEVVIGYPLTYNPWKLAVFKGTFERVTGWTIKWLELKDAVKAVIALGAGEANMVVANSADIAMAVSRDVDAKIIWTIQDLDDSEGLVVHQQYHIDTGSGDPESLIGNPEHLLGKRIAVWWASSQHYSLVRFLEQMNIPYENELDYQFEQPSDLVPKHWWADDQKVTLVPHTREDLWLSWDQVGPHAPIHAAWVGFPHMHHFRQNGTIMLTNRVMSNWRMITFDAFLIDRDWMDNPPVPEGRTMNVRSFLRTFLAEMAKANYYYFNNTKEFGMTHKVTKGVMEEAVLRVDGQISGVLGGEVELTWPHIQMYKYPTIQEQLSCLWLGCGTKSRIAWSLRDQAKFLQTVRYGVGNLRRGLEDGALLTLQEYADVLDAEVLNDLNNNGVNGSYQMTEGEEVEFGYHDDYAE